MTARRRRTRITQADLELARAGLEAEQERLRTSPARSHPRSPDRWVRLPDEWATQCGAAEAVISAGKVWVSVLGEPFERDGRRVYPCIDKCLGRVEDVFGGSRNSENSNAINPQIVSENGCGSPTPQGMNYGDARGRPRKPFPERRFLELMREGLGAPAICRLLKVEGFKVSKRTISRWLAR